MTRAKRRGLVSVVCAALISISAALPAAGAVEASDRAVHPASATVRDRSGDAPAGIDVTKVSVSQTRRQINATIRVNNLTNRNHRAFLLLGSWCCGGTNTMVMEVVRRAGRPHITFWAGYDEQIVRTTCPRARVSWNSAKDVVHLRTDRNCKGADAWFGARFSLTATVYPSFRSDYTRTFAVR